MLKVIFCGRQFYGLNGYRLNLMGYNQGRVLCTRGIYNFTVSFSRCDSVLEYCTCYGYFRRILNPCMNSNNNFTKCSFSSNETQLGNLSKNEFEVICNETLESLCDYFEELIENCGHLKGCDVTYSDGVLTVHFGDEFGTYVINRQTPNRQIWLSSPTSGPKRYDFMPDKKQWMYRHNNKSLHELLQQEIPEIVKSKVNFLKCSYAGR